MYLPAHLLVCSLLQRPHVGSVYFVGIYHSSMYSSISFSSCRTVLADRFTDSCVTALDSCVLGILFCSCIDWLLCVISTPKVSKCLNLVKPYGPRRHDMDIDH